MALILLGILFLVIVFMVLFEFLFPAKRIFESSVNTNVTFKKIKDAASNLRQFKSWYPIYLNEALGLEVIEGYSEDGKTRIWHIPSLPSSGIIKIIDETLNSITFKIELFEKYAPRNCLFEVSFMEGLLTLKQTYYNYSLLSRFYARKGVEWNKKNINLACINLINYVKKNG
jgi:hypothetical protein